MQTVSTTHYEVKLEPLRAEGYNYYNYGSKTRNKARHLKNTKIASE